MKFSQKLKWLAGTLILGALFGGSTPVCAQDLPFYEENTLYVKFKDNSGLSAKTMLNSKSGAKDIQTSLLVSSDLIKRYKIEQKAFSMALFDNPILDKTFLITIDPEFQNNIEQLKEELEQNPDVEYVERVPFNRIFSAYGTHPVNDPDYGTVTDASGQKINVSWHLDMINAEKAWEIQKGDSNIIVAVVDNAIWAEHEDLQIPPTRQYNCYEKIPGTSNPPSQAMAKQDQQCDSSEIRNSSCLAYDFSHGTHCAGAIAAINNNGTGIASIGAGVSLYAIAGPSMQWPSSIMSGYSGISWALSHGAKVISCSWGSEGFNRSDEQILKTCYEHGVIVIAASGNKNTDTPHYPAAYGPYVISVGSVDADSKKSSFSNHGYWVDILSPGGADTAEYKTQIFSTTFCQNQYSRLYGKTDAFTGTYYDEMSGTSMATPILAGVVGLMVSKDSSLTTDQVRSILQNTGHPIHSSHSYYFNEYCTIVDAYEALKFMEGKTYMPTIDSLAAQLSHDSVWLTWRAPKTTATVKGYNVYRNGEKIAEDYKTFAYVDTKRTGGTTYRYAVEPIYENVDFYSSRSEIDVEMDQYYNIAVAIRPSEAYGSVEGAGNYPAGQRYTLTAIPNPGCEFDYWLDETGAKFLQSPLTGPVIRSKQYFAFFKGNPTANEELQLVKKAVRISPNPAKDEINIQCTDYELQHIRISDMRGRIVYNAACIDCKTHSMDINISFWGKGTYAVQVTTSKGTVSHKLIKR